MVADAPTSSQQGDGTGGAGADAQQASPPRPEDQGAAGPDSGAAQRSRRFVGSHRHDPAEEVEEYDLAGPHGEGAEKKVQPGGKAATAHSTGTVPVAPAGKGGKRGLAVPAGGAARAKGVASASGAQSQSSYPVSGPSRKLVLSLAAAVAVLLITNVTTLVLLLGRGEDPKEPAARSSTAIAAGASAQPGAGSPAKPVAASGPVAVIPHAAARVPGKVSVAVVAPRRVSADAGKADTNANPRVLVPCADPKSLVIKYKADAQMPWDELADWSHQELAIPGAAHVRFDAAVSSDGGLVIQVQADDELDRLVQAPRTQPNSLRMQVLKKNLSSCHVRIEDAEGKLVGEFQFALVSAG